MKKSETGDSVLYSDATDPGEVSREMLPRGFVLVTKEQRDWHHKNSKAIEEECAWSMNRCIDLERMWNSSERYAKRCIVEIEAIEEERGRLKAENAELIAQRDSLYDAHVVGYKKLKAELAEARREIEKYKTFYQKHSAAIFGIVRREEEMSKRRIGGACHECGWSGIYCTCDKAALAVKEKEDGELSDYADDPRWEGSVKP